MTSKERLFRMLAHEPVDRIPVIPFIGNWGAKVAGYNLGEYHTDGKKMAQAHIRAHELHGLDAVNPQSDNYYIAQGFGLEAKIMKDETPVVVRRPLDSLDDVYKLKLPNPQTDGRMPVYLEAIQILNDTIGKDVIIRSPGTGPFSMAGHLLGTEDLITEIAVAEVDEDEEAMAKIHHLMEISTQALIDFATASVKCGATMVMDGDSLSSINMISPTIFRKYALPYQVKYFEAMAALKKDYQFVTFLHVCGDNTFVAKDMMQSKCDLIEVDYACDLAKYKEISNETGVCLIGNLNPAGALLSGTPEEVYQDAMNAMNIAAQDRFFVLGSGCEVAVSTPLENVKAMVAAATDFCK